MDEFEKWWESPSGAYDRQHEFLAKAAWKAGREQGMREAAVIAETGAWEPCDCGCPGQQRPKSAQAVGAIRAAKAILAAIGEGE